MCESSRALALSAARYSGMPQPDLAVSFLPRLVTSECQAMSGTIASIRWSIAADTSWMPPPYEPPTIPTRGSPPWSSSAWRWRATQLMIADTSRASNFGLSTSAVPPEPPNPRGSHVSTL